MKPNRIEKIYKGCILAAAIVTLGMLTAVPARAQRNEKAALSKMIGEDRSTIDAIAGCDDKVQDNILQLSQTPEVLDIVQDLQKKSEKRFRDIITPYDRDVQAALYEFARYPDLITELVSHGRPSNSDVNRIAMKYPEDIRKTAAKYARDNYDVLRQIDQLNNEIDKNFQANLAPYDEQTRASVNVLLKHPEIVSLLVEDKEFTRLLGICYREDPDWVTNQIDKIAQELEVQNKKDLDDYKTQVQSDPEAYREMLSAADEFASESNNARDYDTPVDPYVEIQVINNYPYWYGYPYWYPYPYWRPYPVYYHTGFYYGPGRSLVFIGLPSAHFIYWQSHYHPNLYPHLSYSYYNYYHNHYTPYQNMRNRPIANSGFYHAVERNVINNPRVNNERLVKIDRMRGANIVHQPNTMQQSNNTGGRSSAVARQGQISNNNQGQGSGFDGRQGRSGSVKRDAFPKTTPSSISTRSSVDPNQGRSTMNNGGNDRTLRSGQTGSPDQRYQRPASSQGANQTNGTQGVVNRNGFQQRNSPSQSSAQPLKNYRNYRAAVEPRQANPSSMSRETRSVPARISASPARGQSGSGRASQSAGRSSGSSGGRSSGNSREKK
jgi:hypothetical protein